MRKGESMADARTIVLDRELERLLFQYRRLTERENLDVIELMPGASMALIADARGDVALSIADALLQRVGRVRRRRRKPSGALRRMREIKDGPL